MKFLKEQDVPEKVRLLSPLVKDRLPDILQAVVDILNKDHPSPPAIDLAPIVDAIRARPQPAPVQPATKWEFTVHRDSQGFIDTVRATRKNNDVPETSYLENTI